MTTPAPRAGSGASLVEILEDGRFVNLFVHDATSAAPFEALTRRVPGIANYDQRALLLAGSRDLVCLRERPDESYLDYLVGLGLGLRREGVVTPEELGAAPGRGPVAQRLLGQPAALAELLRRLGNRGRIRLHSFLAAEGEFALGAALERAGGGPVQVAGGPRAVIDHSNQKHRMRAKARELGIPVGPGEVVELETSAGDGESKPLRAAIERQGVFSGRVLVRGTRGASGSATLLVDADSPQIELQLGALVRRGENRIFLVDPFLPVTLSPNLQLHIDPDSGAIERVGITDQILADGIEHRGNVAPSRARHAGAMWEHAEALGRWLRDEGCNGIVGFDFCELEPGCLDCDYFLAEVNARTNGASYSVGLFERLVRRCRGAGCEPPRACVARSLATRLADFDAVQRAAGNLLLPPAGATGLVPFQLATLPHGRVSVAAFGSTPEVAAELCREAEQRLR